MLEALNYQILFMVFLCLIFIPLLITIRSKDI